MSRDANDEKAAWDLLARLDEMFSTIGKQNTRFDSDMLWIMFFTLWYPAQKNFFFIFTDFILERFRKELSQEAKAARAAIVSDVVEAISNHKGSGIAVTLVDLAAFVKPLLHWMELCSSMLFCVLIKNILLFGNQQLLRYTPSRGQFFFPTCHPSTHLSAV